MSQRLSHFLRIYALPVGVVGAAIALAIVTVVVASAKTPNRPAAALLQALTLLLTIGASFAVGRASARVAAEDLLRPHARSAFRRGFGLYLAFGRLNQSIQERQLLIQEATNEDGTVDSRYVSMALDLLRAQVIEQIGTANDALGDWRDIVPDEVRAVEAEYQVRPPLSASPRTEPTSSNPAVSNTEIHVDELDEQDPNRKRPNA